jgi:hypothetical protein
MELRAKPTKPLLWACSSRGQVHNLPCRLSVLSVLIRNLENSMLPRDWDFFPITSGAHCINGNTLWVVLWSLLVATLDPNQVMGQTLTADDPPKQPFAAAQSFFRRSVRYRSLSVTAQSRVPDTGLATGRESGLCHAPRDTLICRMAIILQRRVLIRGSPFAFRLNSE